MWKWGRYCWLLWYFCKSIREHMNCWMFLKYFAKMCRTFHILLQIELFLLQETCVRHSMFCALELSNPYVLCQQGKLYWVGKVVLQMAHPKGVTCRTSGVVCSKGCRAGFLTWSKDSQNGIRNIIWEEAQKTTDRAPAKHFTWQHTCCAPLRLGRVRWWGYCLPLSFWFQGVASCMLKQMLSFMVVVKNCGVYRLVSGCGLTDCASGEECRLARLWQNAPLKTVL